MTTRSTPGPRRVPTSVWASWVLFVTLGTITSSWRWHHPEWNFDAVMYVASSHALTDDAPDRARARAFAELRQQAPMRAHRQIASASAYRRAIARDAAAFETQRPFYDTKPGYVAAIAGLTALGLPSFRAAHLISLLGYIATALLIVGAGWPRLRHRALWAGSLALLIPSMLESSRLATPDAMSASLVVLGLMLILRGRDGPGMWTLALSVLVRPDNLLMALGVAVWRVGLRHRRSVASLTAPLAAALLYGLVARDAHPWSVLFWHTFVGPLYQPDAMAATIDARQYLEVLGEGLTGGYVASPPTSALLVGLAGLCGWRLREAGDPLRELLAVSWAVALAHFVVFPHPGDRFFVVPHVVTLLALAHALLEAPARPPLTPPP